MISVIIVNYNLSGEILDCLESLDRNLDQNAVEVIVVDNNSSDDYKSELINRLQQNSNYHFIQLETNLGFGSACNRGVTISQGELVCFLNPDTTISHNFLSELEESLMQSGATIVGPGYNKSTLIEFSAGLFPSVLLELLSVFFIGRHIEALIMGIRARLVGQRWLSVDWVLGACMLMRKQNFQSIGGFDESFFLYFEEMDLCKRVVDSGGTIVFVPDCRISHLGSVSGVKDYSLFTQRFYEGKIRFLSKHFLGLKRLTLLRLVWLQLHSQKLLWHVLAILHPVKADQKKRGLDGARLFYTKHV